MNAAEHFTMADGHAAYRPTGQMTLEQAVDMVTVAIVSAREQKIRSLLINVSALTGFDSPDIAARYFFVKKWAQAAGGLVRIGFVARPEMIDPAKFGITVAANNGLIADVFPSEHDALIWLQSKRG